MFFFIFSDHLLRTNSWCMVWTVIFEVYTKMLRLHVLAWKSPCRSPEIFGSLQQGCVTCSESNWKSSFGEFQVTTFRTSAAEHYQCVSRNVHVNQCDISPGVCKARSELYGLKKGKFLAATHTITTFARAKWLLNSVCVCFFFRPGSRNAPEKG